MCSAASASSAALGIMSLPVRFLSREWPIAPPAQWNVSAAWLSRKWQEVFGDDQPVRARDLRNIIHIVVTEKRGISRRRIRIAAVARGVVDARAPWNIRAMHAARDFWTL